MTLRGVTTLADATGRVATFERAFREATGAKYSLAMNSGTSTLHSAYFAVGVGPGAEVICPSYTWHASATPVLQCGAVPVFAEIDPATLTLDLEDAERRITERTRAICVVHIWGNPAPMDRVIELADKHGLAVIEDCSHAHGSSYKGRSVGTWGAVGCFSLQGAKCVQGGEAGVAITDNATLFDRMLLLGHNFLVKSGQKADTFKDFGDISLGVKYRPHLASMYIAYPSLCRLPKRNKKAARAWEILCEELRDTPGIRAIESHEGAVRGGYYAFVLEYTGEALGGCNTEEFVRAVGAKGVPIDLDQFRGRLLHTHPLFTALDRSQLGGSCYDWTRPLDENLSSVSLPVTEQITERLVRLPPALYDLSEDYVRNCARGIKKVLAELVPSGAGAQAEP